MSWYRQPSCQDRPPVVPPKSGADTDEYIQSAHTDKTGIRKGTRGVVPESTTRVECEPLGLLVG